MSITFTLHGVFFEAVASTKGSAVESDRNHAFSGQFEVARFVDDVFDNVHDPVSLLQPLYTGQMLVAADEASVKAWLAEAINNQTVVIQHQPIMSGASGATNAPAVEPVIIDPVAEASISSMYSPQMRQYLLQNQSLNQSQVFSRSGDTNGSTRSGQSSSGATGAASNSSGDTSKPGALDPEDTKYKIVIEIAGRNACKKQTIQINDIADGAADAPVGMFSQQERAGNDMKACHRSLITFKQLPKSPRKLDLKIATSGYGSDILLPLADAINPVNKDIEKPEWDTVLIPVKPLVYLTPAKKTEEADALEKGWLYIFWRGKLWRELQVNPNQSLKDVDVAFYRSNWNGDLGQSPIREATGHQTLAPWIPYKIDGEMQTGANQARMAFSTDQWDWPYIESLESDGEKMNRLTTAVDVSHYSADKHFKQAAAPMGSIETALADQVVEESALRRPLISPQGKNLKGYRDTLMPVVYLVNHEALFMFNLKNRQGKKLSNMPVAVLLGGKTYEAMSDKQGVIEIKLDEELNPDTELNGEIKVWKNAEAKDQGKAPKLVKTFNTQAQELPDVATVEGQQLRLNNLSFNAGTVDGIMGRKTRAATTEFQKNVSINADGICGPITQRKLKQAHQR